VPRSSAMKWQSYFWWLYYVNVTVSAIIQLYVAGLWHFMMMASWWKCYWHWSLGVYREFNVLCCLKLYFSVVFVAVLRCHVCIMFGDYQPLVGFFRTFSICLCYPAAVDVCLLCHLFISAGVKQPLQSEVCWWMKEGWDQRLLSPGCGHCFLFAYTIDWLTRRTSGRDTWGSVLE